MKRSSFVFVLAAAALALGPGCGDSGSPGQETVDHCGDIKAAVYPIINGTNFPDPDVVVMTEGQIKAVGAIKVNGGTYMCSAALVAPNIVLTAAHCISMRVSNVTFVGGNNMWREDFSYPAFEWHMNPLYDGLQPDNDVAIIRISGDTAALGIEPIPVNCETMSLLGETLQLVGYGQTASGWSGIRYWTTMYVNRETPGYMSLYGDGLTGMCSGDSGGPALYTREDGNVYVVGVTSSVDDTSDCLGHTYYPRTDYNCEFITQYVDLDPCDGETLQGRCDGNTAIWCEADTIMTEDCAALGYTCGPDGSGNSRCLPPVDPCAGETWEGRCDGQTAIWCEADAVHTEPCPEGTLCDALDDGLHRCIDECVLIGRTGRCDENNMARWCEDGALKVRDCGLCEQTCGWIDQVMGYYCY
jgi:V8-like Glu-specific endopeptidase